MCFAVDCTGSMAPFIAVIQSDIGNLVSNISNIYPDVNLRLAFVAYRNHGDEDRIVSFDFTDNLSLFTSQVSSQTAHGGGDGLADVFGALDTVTRLDWTANSRILMHIGDVPCHGLRYHLPIYGDSFPQGDPNGIQAEKFLPRLSELRIEYLFGKIKNYTDQMIKEFNSIMGMNFITQIDAKDPSRIMNAASEKAIASVAQSISCSLSTLQIRELEPVVILPAREPRWSALTADGAYKYRISSRATLATLLHEDDFVESDPIPALIQVKVAPSPFAQGGSRVVYRAQEINKHGESTLCVHKVSRLKKRSDNDQIAAFQTEIASTYYVVKLLLEKFTSLLRAVCQDIVLQNITLTDVSLVKYHSQSSIGYVVQEEYLAGTFEKYNNNTGMVAACPTKVGTDHRILQAFSHWTYVYSERTLMVVDCQGVFDKKLNTFKLTDPAVHCSDVTRFGGTNLATFGFERFFKTHRCNQYCHSLGC